MRSITVLRAALVGLGLLLSALAQAAEPARRVALADERMAATPSGRELLKYLANCALAEDQVLTAEHEGRAFEFPGAIGLAPEWHSRPMSEAEQRWVSACLLARTNHFGVKVVLSLRSEFPSNAPGLQILGEEDAAYTLEEGSFFGNLFADRPTGYVCGPTQSEQRRALLQAHRRVCALPGANGVSACGIRHVGACSPQALQQDGIDYREALAVFLPAEPVP
jgi:hypothetical protein